MHTCQYKKLFMRFGRFFEICDESTEVGGNTQSERLSRGHVSNDKAHIPS